MMDGWLISLIGVGSVLYVILGIAYLVAVWHAANNCVDGMTKTQLRRHAARLTLLGPFWLPVLIFYELRVLLKTAELWPQPKKKLKVSHEMCPSCLKKIKRGPMR